MMKPLQKTLRAAIVQAAPLLFDKEGTLDNVCRQIGEAGRNGARLIVFPESLIPCYPYGLTFGFTVGSRSEAGRRDWKTYYDNALAVPGNDTRRIGDAAKEADAYVSIGITERDRANASLYCTNLIFGPDGTLLAKHRKIKPTGAERYIWADSHDKATYFPVTDTPWGPMGTLICWENYMPLARVALYDKGISIYLAPNTNDNPEWQDTIRHIAIESHCYVFNADQYFTKAMYPATLLETAEIAALNDTVCRGGSCIIDPYGHYVTEPVWDREAIIYADLDFDKVPMSRMEFDGSGHYSRPDILELIVHE
ncbi:carbon-nitrogen hydrolase family protein [Megasphaera vaginalis (ex Srinivasan et al. 2021)]|uniref:Hydrolase, carbon-nitrogen family n=1 Tax=Megasphaera vaginalis (ex Srinivasan et al. 2021) TaxID=1111454 RepID=U7UF70_9FIRM|nr:carbon-nitrogen hydrolase family protein [Megasphaera vaginalis (ex Srinivasan et al. 2021)]ERT57995.1 hydrolase, carbon-nitrogen family [Megasphaera vaginalis (ex Srinivasan et al. 2021)]